MNDVKLIINNKDKEVEIIYGRDMELKKLSQFR